MNQTATDQVCSGAIDTAAKNITAANNVADSILEFLCGPRDSIPASPRAPGFLQDCVEIVKDTDILNGKLSSIATVLGMKK